MLFSTIYIPFILVLFLVTPLGAVLFSYFVASETRLQSDRYIFMVALALLMGFLTALKIPVSDHLYLIEIADRVSVGDTATLSHLYLKEPIFFAFFLVMASVAPSHYLVPAIVFTGYLSIFMALDNFFRIRAVGIAAYTMPIIFIVLNPLIFNNAGHLSRQFLAGSIALLVVSLVSGKCSKYHLLRVAPFFIHLSAIFAIVPLRKLIFGIPVLLIVVSFISVFSIDSVIYIFSRLDSMKENFGSEAYIFSRITFIYILGSFIFLGLGFRRIEYFKSQEVFYYLAIIFFFLIIASIYNFHFWGIRAFFYYVLFSVFLLAFFIGRSAISLGVIFALFVYFVFNIIFGPWEYASLGRIIFNFYG